MSKFLDYKDIALAPRVVSTLTSRSEADTGVDCFGIHLDIPLIASPMPDVCNGEMAARLAELGALGIIHRFQPINQQVEEFTYVESSLGDAGRSVNGKFNIAACAIGATGDYQERFVALYDAGCRIFCIDTANGANIQVACAIDWIHEWERKMIVKYEGAHVYLIAGNVATAEGYQFMATLEVDAVRVGIAGGSKCSTYMETGVYVPMITSLQECNEVRIKLLVEGKTAPLIIADGGIKTPSDMNKALAVGADLCFAGSIFAGTSESPGNVIKDNVGNLVKLYRGAASFSVQQEYNEKEPDFVEGKEGMVPYTGKVEKVIKRFKGGLKSAMSYMNSRTLEEFKDNVSIIEL